MAIEILRRSGLNVFAKDGTLLVSPKERITDEIRDFIRRHKEQVIAELERESQSANDPTTLARRYGLSVDLVRRIIAMGERWKCSSDELAEVLAEASQDPEVIERMTSYDERITLPGVTSIEAIEKLSRSLECNNVTFETAGFGAATCDKFLPEEAEK